ncbi:hypothetical protein F0U61_48060 [Archangium violaceum]|uniref:hypothetical protein n=1 Tax=Archangium violaceum TaxID=83451 RepID=UPI002B2C1473|nr:hypothetical protein F0U61_48060 [Archangium violaceum]
MGRRLLHASEHIDIHHAESEGWLYVDWKGYQSVDMVKSGCEELLRHLAALRLSKVLNDNTHVSGIWVGAAYWLATYWFPRMREAGLRHFAWVLSPSRLSQLSTTTTLQHADPNTAVLFEDLASAVHWLRNADPAQTTGLS